MSIAGWHHKEAISGKRRLRLGIGGPSRSGKTFSALRVAAGLVSVTGGEIFLIDTDNDFALDYADDFKFQHVDFQPPFTSERYKSVVEYCVSQNPGIIIVDHMTHEHTGDGGMLERQEKIADELAAKWKTTRDKATWAAWAQAKDPHTKFVSFITRVKQPMIFNFRAKDKLKLIKKPDGKQEAVQIGYTPICVEQFDYEMSAMLILPPNSDGTTDKDLSEIRGPLRKVIRLGEQIDEGMGKRLAEWAAGGVKPPEPESKETSPGEPETIPATPTQVAEIQRLMKTKGITTKADYEAFWRYVMTKNDTGLAQKFIDNFGEYYKIYSRILEES